MGGTVHEMGLRILVNLEVAEFRTEYALTIRRSKCITASSFFQSSQFYVKVGMIAANQRKSNYGKLFRAK